MAYTRLGGADKSETHIEWRGAGEEEEIAKAVEAIAELALLGGGATLTSSSQSPLDEGVCCIWG